MPLFLFCLGGADCHHFVLLNGLHCHYPYCLFLSSYCSLLLFLLSFFGKSSKHGSFHILCDHFFLFLSSLSLIATMIEKDIESPL